jgi:hypothetical protein
VRLQGWNRERRIIIVRTLKPANPSPQDLFWETPRDETAVYVTDLDRGEATREQVALLHAQWAVCATAKSFIPPSWASW